MIGHDEQLGMEDQGYPMDDGGALIPTEAQARKRKRRMLVDEILELGQKEISRALKDTSDIVTNLDRMNLVSIDLLKSMDD